MKSPQPLRVLLAEDESLVGNVIEAEVEKCGHTVIARAFNGNQALELTQAMNPDVVLMDIEMPVMDGLQATRRIVETMSSPVILLSAHDSPRFVAEAAAAGAVGYLVKPASAQEMARTIAMGMARHKEHLEASQVSRELTSAENAVTMLSSLIPFCAKCGRIKNALNEWESVERYPLRISVHELSASTCPDCLSLPSDRSPEE